MLLKRICLLRKIALFLFITAFVGVVGSLITHNYFVAFNFQKNTVFPIKGNQPGETTLQLCNISNNYCEWDSYKLANKLDECSSYKIKTSTIKIKGTDQNIFDTFNLKNEKEKPFLKQFQTVDEKDNFCIKNSKLFKLYVIFPYLFEKTHEIKSKKNFSLGTSITVNPFLYGETSISNIVKRYPVKYVFKSLMFASSILMIVYWTLYLNIFNSIFNEKKKYSFFVFGVLSSIFLFLHSFSLGVNFESEFFLKLKKSYIIFFIVFEILAQIFLIKSILIKKGILINYLNNKIIILKLNFVRFICAITLVMLSIFIFFNLDSKFDYIVEWNYFVILLIFYILSFLLWKKNLILNPSTA